MAEAQKSIQATLFDYFQDTEYFTLQEAEEHVLDHQKRDVNVPSVRARIYEGIEKGLFERVGKGLYTVTRTDEQGRENISPAISSLNFFRRRTAITTNTCTASKTLPVRPALNTTPRYHGRLYRPIQVSSLHFNVFYELYI